MAREGWFVDPLRRHDQRWHDGAAWTDRVRDNGVESTSAYEGASQLAHRSGWFADPSRAHQYRFHSGYQWTDRVRDSGVESVDPLRPRQPRDETEKLVLWCGWLTALSLFLPFLAIISFVLAIIVITRGRTTFGVVCLTLSVLLPLAGVAIAINA